MAQQSTGGSQVALQARGGALDRGNGQAPPRTVRQIERDIETTRSRLAGTVDQIADRVAPRNVLARLKAAAKAQVVDPVTGPRYDRIAIAAGVVVTIVGLRVWRARH